MCFYDPESKSIPWNVIEMHSPSIFLPLWMINQTGQSHPQSKAMSSLCPSSWSRTKKRVIPHLSKNFPLSEQVLSWGMGTPQRLFLIKQTASSLSCLFFNYQTSWIRLVLQEESPSKWQRHSAWRWRRKTKLIPQPGFNEIKHSFNVSWLISNRDNFSCAAQLSETRPEGTAHIP